MAITTTPKLSFKDGHCFIETFIGDQPLRVKAALDGALELTLSGDKESLKHRDITIYPAIPCLNQALVDRYNIMVVSRPDQGTSLYLYISPSNDVDVEEIFNSLDVCLQGIASESTPLDQKIQLFHEIREGITQLQDSIELDLETTRSEIEKLDRIVLKTGGSYVDGCKRKKELKDQQSARYVEVASLEGKINALIQTIASLQSTIATLATDLYKLHRHVSGWLRKHRRQIIKEKEAQKSSYEMILASRIQERDMSIEKKRQTLTQIAQRNIELQELSTEIMRIDHEKLQRINERVELAEAKLALDTLITRSDFLKEQIEIVEERMHAGRSFNEDILMISSGIKDLKQRFSLEKEPTEISASTEKRHEVIKFLKTITCDKDLDPDTRDGATSVLKNLM